MYMIVTNDKFELPLAVFDTCAELAEHLGVSQAYIRNRMHRDRWKQDKIVKVSDGKSKSQRKKEYQKKYRKTHDRSEYYREYYQKKKERKKNEQSNRSVERSIENA